MHIVTPSVTYLTSYRAAVALGWPHSPEANQGELARSEGNLDDGAFLAQLSDRSGGGRPLTLPDGSTVPRLPGIEMWMWDGSFCGRINLRWQPGTTELPPTCLGHIGYMVVPWRRRRGYATAALGQILPLAREVGLPWVDVTTDPDNVASQRVIVANGGTLVDQFDKPVALGGGPVLRFRIALNALPDKRDSE